MKLKWLALVSAVLMVAALAAFALNRWGTGPSARGRVGQPLMTGIDTAQARQVEIVSAEGTVTLTSADGQSWVVAEQHNFPVDTKHIKGLFFTLTTRTLAHLVTENPDKLADLGLLTPEEQGDQPQAEQAGTVIRIRGGNDAPLFQLVVGNTRIGEGSMTFGGVYVRYPQEQAAYLVGDSIVTDLRPQDWIDNQVLDLDAEQTLQSIRVEKPGARPLEFSRAKPGDPWRLAGVADGQLAQDEVQRLASQLAGMDVFKVASPDVAPKAVGRTRIGRLQFALFDKRRYTLDIGLDKGEDDFRYLTLQAELADGSADEALAARVQAFNERFEGRLLAVYDWDGSQLVRDRADFVAK